MSSTTNWQAEAERLRAELSAANARAERYLAERNTARLAAQREVSETVRKLREERDAALAQLGGAAPTCSSNGLLGASSGVGRECGMWIDGVCTSPEPCQHQQRPWCGADLRAAQEDDSVVCPKGGAA